MLGSDASTRANRGERTTRGGAVDQGLEHLRRTQHEDGSWHGDYGGPLFLLPLYVATCHVAGLNIDLAAQREMRRYL